ncbi:MAG: alanine racemase [Rikenellaceae bacterium]
MHYKYSLGQISEIVKGEIVGGSVNVDAIAGEFVFDSRLLFSSDSVMFIAIRGDRVDGHNYIEECYDRGVRMFLISDRTIDFNRYSDAAFLVVDDSLKALQTLATYHRKQFKGEVVAITGSNGKSVVKETIAQLYDGDEPIFKSPKSYNSQLGVALSLLMINGDEKVAIIEAGISKCGEMANLAQMIRPDVVVITNIGDAHGENFSSKEQKLVEKLILAMQKGCKKIFYRKNSWESGFIEESFSREKLNGWSGKNFDVKSLLSDEISFENCCCALALLKYLDMMPQNVEQQISLLQPLAMRMEVRQGQYQMQIINDSYSNDFGSLKMTLSFMESITEKGRGRVVILSDIQQSSIKGSKLYVKVAQLLKDASVDRLFAVGEKIGENRELFGGIDSSFFSSVDELVASINPKELANSTILLKGGRIFAFERILKVIELKHHNTILEVNLDNMLHNLNFYRSKIGSNTKMMAMVKASGYGSGSWEVARQLDKANIDYLAVAFADEGVTLRENGVKAAIVVLGSDPFSHRAMIENNLEPEMHSLELLKRFITECKAMAVDNYPIHIKIDSGMRRTGFRKEDIEPLLAILKANSAVKVSSIFSHLVGSDSTEFDSFTREQIECFEALSSQIIENLPYKVIRHICNSSAICRFPEAHYEMVRLGIGLYGYGSDSEFLQPISALKSVIVQISKVEKGESVGYSRAQRVERDSTIATIAIGYADGLRRELSCGSWSVELSGVLCPIVGNICMDSTMVDISEVAQKREVKVGEYVEIFGYKKGHTAADMALRLSTIEYEVLTSVAPRVKRLVVRD